MTRVVLAACSIVRPCAPDGRALHCVQGSPQFETKMYCHYNGSASNDSLIGYAMAEVLLEMAGEK